MKRVSTAGQPASPAKQLAEFVDKFDPAVAKLVRAARSALRKRLPTAVEQVYDNWRPSFMRPSRGPKSPLPATGRGYTVIKSVSAKQRPRRLTSSSKGSSR